MEIDVLLAAVMRRLPNVRGMWRLREALRKHYVQHYAGSEKAWAVIKDFDTNLRMCLDCASHLGSADYWFGTSSAAELRLLNAFLKPNMTFVDIGGNQGEITLFAAKRVPQVLVFEPHPVLFALLEENIGLNRFLNVQAFNFALADSPGIMNHEGLSSLFSSHPESLVGEVEVTTLDRVMRDRNALDFIKIDVEGAELHVVRGAQETLQRCKPTLMLELNQNTLAAAGYTPQDLLSFIGNWGYKVLLVEDKGLVELPKRSIPSFCNILMLCVAL